MLLAAALGTMAASLPARDAPARGVVRIVATDAGFEAPTSIPAGLRHIVFTNRGREIHEAMLVKLPDGMDADGYVAAVRRGELFPRGALDYSGAALISPGETAEIWVPVDPGRYVVICWNRDHARTRRAHTLIATARGAHDDAPPPEDAVLRLVDFRFELSQPLRKGVQIVRVDTVGPSMHEADLYRLHDGHTLDELVAWRRTDEAGPAPAVALGGVLDSHDLSHRTWMRLNLAPGRYVLHCEMPMDHDAQAGTGFATHADAGMVSEFVIGE